MREEQEQWQEKGHLLILYVVQESKSWQKKIGPQLTFV